MTSSILHPAICPHCVVYRQNETPGQATAPAPEQAHPSAGIVREALLANNAILIVRMLVDNFRSFAEVKPHILLNYPLAAIAACLAVALAVGRKKSTASPGQRAFSLVTVLMLAALIALLYNWQFFVVLA